MQRSTPVAWSICILTTGALCCALACMPSGGDSSPSPSPTTSPSPTASPSPGDDEPVNLALRLLLSGLIRPADLQAPADGSDRLFIVEQEGRIRVVRDGELLDVSFLDISDLVVSGGNEQGLLGLAFHPDYADNGRFFINYTAPTEDGFETRIAEYHVSDDDPDVAATEETLLLRYDQPHVYHNGGQLQFGPDGMLYVAAGDGGVICNTENPAQNLLSPLGKILRLDVDAAPDYVPSDNPFAAQDNAEPHVWVFGVRNPWRFSFDTETGLVFIADVGEGSREEVNVLPIEEASGANFGWPAYEGTLSPPPACGGEVDPIESAILPTFEYSHESGCSVTGGYVYRGGALSGWSGVYFFTDFCDARLRALRVRSDIGEIEPAEVREVAIIGGSPDNPTSFGVDSDGELYLLDHDGDVFVFEAR